MLPNNGTDEKQERAHSVMVDGFLLHEIPGVIKLIIPLVALMPHYSKFPDKTA